MTNEPIWNAAVLTAPCTCDMCLLEDADFAALLAEFSWEERGMQAGELANVDKYIYDINYVTYITLNNLDKPYGLGYGSHMETFEIVLMFIAFGVLSSITVAIAIDFAQSRRYDKREREIIKSIVKDSNA